MRKLILFDFDGTLADTAPDLAGAANRLRTERGLPPLPYETLRPFASQGARGLLRTGLDMGTDHPEYETQRQCFLAVYERHMADESRLFDGIESMLATLTQHGHAWGIVTNKMEYLALPLVQHLGLAAQCAITVGGDTTPHPKPHPAPLLYAAERTGFQPEDCLYVGDDERDIAAGRAAGMATIAVAYGYGGQYPGITGWRADAIADTPHALWPHIDNWTKGQGFGTM